MGVARRGGVAVVALAVVGVSGIGCASTAEVPVTAPAAAALGPQRVPPAAPSSSGPVAEAWEAVRGAALESAAVLVAALSPADAASPEGRTAFGFLALRRGDLIAAQDAFGAAASAQPLLGEAAYGMALVARARGDDQLARRWLDSATAATPTLTRADVARRSLDLEIVESELLRAERAAAAGDSAVALESYRRVIGLSPLSSGAYTQAARIQAHSGDREGAIETLRRGIAVTGDDTAMLEPLAAMLSDAGRLAEAAGAWRRLAELVPDDTRITGLARAARDRYEEESLPIEYRALAQRSVISREELAAILAINLVELEGRIPTTEGVIVSDSGGRWSTPFVQRMVQWGVLDVYQNDFMPEMEVRRSMLVEACYRVLELVGAEAGAPRPTLQDPPRQHLLYRPVQVVVGLELMDAGRDGSFDLLAPVSGAEALRTAERLAALLRQ